MARPIDHLVIATRDLEAAAEIYRTLGFQVGSRNRHPWGTENHVVQLPGQFLELIGLAEDFIPLGDDAPAAPFAAALGAYLTRREGLALVALQSTDARHDAALFAGAGIGAGRMLDFSRSADAADGTRREVAFSLAFLNEGPAGAPWFFTCQHHRPENFWSAAAQNHPNGASSILGLEVLVHDPARHAGALETIFGTHSLTPIGSGLRIATGGGSIDMLASGPGDPEGFVTARIGVESIDVTRRLFQDRGIRFDSAAEALIVPDVGGLTLVFEASAKDIT